MNMIPTYPESKWEITEIKPNSSEKGNSINCKHIWHPSPYFKRGTHEGLCKKCRRAILVEEIKPS